MAGPAGALPIEEQALRPKPAKEKNAVWALTSPGGAPLAGPKGRGQKQDPKQPGEAQGGDQRVSPPCKSAMREVSSGPGTWVPGTVSSSWLLTCFSPPHR